MSERRRKVAQWKGEVCLISTKLKSRERRREVVQGMIEIVTKIEMCERVGEVIDWLVEPCI
jgi:hypothetical protein